MAVEKDSWWLLLEPCIAAKRTGHSRRRWEGLVPSRVTLWSSLKPFITWIVQITISWLVVWQKRLAEWLKRGLWSRDERAELCRVPRAAALSGAICGEGMQSASAVLFWIGCFGETKWNHCENNPGVFMTTSETWEVGALVLRDVCSKMASWACPITGSLQPAL